MIDHDTHDTNSSAALIEPARSDAELVAEIAAERPEPGAATLWWLGQSGFLIKFPDVTLLIDPYLSESLTTKYAQTDRPHIRMTRAALRPDQTAGLVDLVLCSHKHSDHLDPATVPEVLRVNPQAKLVLPAALWDHALGLGLDVRRLVGLESGTVVAAPRGGVTIRAVPSAHETLERDHLGRHWFLGFVIECQGGALRMYHSGDTMRYDGLEEQLGPGPWDLLMLPINGRDPARGVAGNMGIAEALGVAARMRPRFLIPHHFEMFTFNTADRNDFRRHACGEGGLPAEVQPVDLRCGQRWVCPPRSPRVVESEGTSPA